MFDLHFGNNFVQYAGGIHPLHYLFTLETSDLKIQLPTTLVLSVSIRPIRHVSRRGLVEHIIDCCYVYMAWHGKVAG